MGVIVQDEENKHERESEVLEPGYKFEVSCARKCQSETCHAMTPHCALASVCAWGTVHGQVGSTCKSVPASDKTSCY